VALEVLEMVYASLGDCCMKIQSLLDVWFGSLLCLSGLSFEDTVREQ